MSYASAPYGAATFQGFPVPGLGIESPQQATIQILLSGIDQTARIRSRRTIRMSDQLNNRNTLTFEMFDTAQTYRPKVGEPTEFRYNSTVVFRGTIDSVNELDPLAGKVNFFKVSCVDFNQLTDRFVINANFEVPTQTLKDIVENIVNVQAEGGLAAEGVTTTKVQTGPVISGKVIFPFMTIRDAFDDLTDITGFYWFIDCNRVLHFEDRTTTTAPFSIDSGAVSPASTRYRTLRSRKTRQKYRNRQFFRAGLQTTTLAKVDRFTGDGEQRTFTLRFPVSNDPDIAPPTVTLNAASQTIGIRAHGEDDSSFQWYYNVEERFLEHDTNETVLTAADTLIITYFGLFPIIVIDQDNAEIASRSSIEGGTGKYEVYEEDQRISSRDLALDRTAGLLRKFGEIPEILTLETLDFGLHAGQLINVQASEHGINANYLIDEVRFSELGANSLGTVFGFRITALSGEHQGGWVEFFRRLAEGGREFKIRENESLVIARKETEVINLDDTLVVTTDSNDLLQNPEDEDPYTRAKIGFDVFASAGANPVFTDVPSMVAGYWLIGPHPLLAAALMAKVVAHYKLDETGVAANALDAHVGGLDLTHTTAGSPSGNVAGLIGRARTFNRLAGQHFLRSDSGAADPFRLGGGAAGFALNGWVQIGTKFATTFQTLFSKATTGNNEYFLFYDTTADAPAFQMVNTTPAAFTATGTTSLAAALPGTWTMLTAVYNAVSKLLEIYVDGVRQGTATLTGTPNVGSAPINLGGEAGIGLFWDGWIDETTVFKNPLTQTEITFLFNLGAGKPFPFA